MASEKRIGNRVKAIGAAHRRFIAAGIALCLMLVAGLWLAPRLIHLDVVKDQIGDQLGRHIGGSVQIRDLTIAGGWGLRLRAGNVAFNVPETAAGEAPELIVRPYLWPLLKGQLHIAELIVVNPRLRLTPDQDRADPGIVAAVVQALTRPLPDVTIRGGRLEVAGALPLHLDDMAVSASARHGEVRFFCTSSLWQSLSATYRVDPQTLHGQGHIALTGGRGDRISSWLGESAAAVADGRLDLTVDLATRPEGRLLAEARGQFEFLTLARAGGAKLENAQLVARLTMDADGAELVVDQFQTASPRLDLSGRVRIENGGQRPVAVTIAGRDLDAAATGQVLMAAGVVPAIMAQVTRIVQAGDVPEIRVQIHSPSFENFSHEARTRLDGRLVGGRIFVPGPGLDLAGVDAVVELEDGVLTASGLTARFGQITGTGGFLAIGFHADAPLLHLEMDVEAQVASLAKDLKALDPDGQGRWIGAFDHLTDPVGRIGGRLLIGDRLGDARTRVTLSAIDLKAGLVHSPLALTVRGGRIVWEQGRLQAGGVALGIGASTLSGVGGTITEDQEVHVDLHAAEGSIEAAEAFPLVMGLFGRPAWIQEDARFEGQALVSDLAVSGPLGLPGQWDVAFDARSQALVAVNGPMAGRLALPGGRVSFRRSPAGLHLQWADARAEVLASFLEGSGSYVRQAGQSRLEALVNGRVEKPLLEWLAGVAGTPLLNRLRTPLGLDQAKLAWDGAKEVLFGGRLLSYQGSEAAVTFSGSATGLNLSVAVADDFSRAGVTVVYDGGSLALGFDGLLLGPSLNAFIEKTEPCRSCKLEGRFTAALNRQRPEASSARGKLAIRNLVFDDGLALHVETADLAGLGDKVTIADASGFLKDNPLRLGGDLRFNEAGLSAILEVSGGKWNWETLAQIFGEDPGGTETLAVLGWPLQVSVNLSVEELAMGRWRLRSVMADLAVLPGELTAVIANADLCGITVKGKVISGPQGLSVELSPFADRQPLDIQCLGATQAQMDGTADLISQLRAFGLPLSQTLTGAFDVKCRNGRIQRFTLLARVLALINVTEIMVGRLPDLINTGLAYNQIDIKASVADGRLSLNEIVMDAESLKITGQGSVDLATWQVDLSLSLAPLKTIDRVIRRLPVAGDILQGTLVAIPVRVTGPLADPKVSYMPLGAVGDNLLELMKRVLRYPFKLITPQANE